jgi:branched-chain amino acid transport system permease protein
MSFFFEVLIGGLLSGVMYSLVALGFVLIYKASGVFNFAQGAMVFFAALTYVGLLEHGFSPWLAIPATLVVMIVLGLVTERVVLRPLVNQPQITLFMATIGLTFFIEGLAQMTWGANVRGLELGLQDEPLQWITDTTGMNVSKFDLVAAGVAAILVTVLALSSAARESGERCAPWPTITRRHSPSAFRCSRSGRSCGASPVRSRWWRACCGVHATASSTR